MVTQFKFLNSKPVNNEPEKPTNLEAPKKGSCKVGGPAAQGLMRYMTLGFRVMDLGFKV